MVVVGNEGKALCKKLVFVAPLPDHRLGPTASLNSTVRSSVVPGDQFSAQAPDALPITDPEFAVRRSRTAKSPDLAGAVRAAEPRAGAWLKSGLRVA